MVADRVDRGQPADLLLLQPPGEHRGLEDPHPDVEPDRDHHQAEDERDPPAPGLELRVGQLPAQQVEEPGAEDQPERHAELRQARHQPTALLVAPLHRQQHRAAPLTADREALQQPQQHEQDRRGSRSCPCPAADRPAVVERPITEQGDDQGRLAADPVTPVTEDRGADRAGGEPHGVRRERLEPTGVLRRRGEEQRREDEGGGGVVEEEVVPLDGGADGAGEGRLADLAAVLGAPFDGGGRRGWLRIEASWDWSLLLRPDAAGARPSRDRSREDPVPPPYPECDGRNTRIRVRATPG